MSRHIEAVECLTALWQIVPLLASASDIIVSKRWPPPRWFLGASAPPGTDFVIVGTDFVIVGTDNVIAPSP